MAISDTITSMYENVGNVYDVLELAGADLTNVDKNIQNLKQSWEERLLYFLANGTDVVWNNWLPKVTGSGESITLNNTIEAKMDFVYKGNTSQKTTTGKNLFNSIYYKNQEIYTETISISTGNLYCTKLYLKPNTTYTISEALNNWSLDGGWIFVVADTNNQIIRYLQNRQQDYQTTPTTFTTNSEGYVYIGHRYGFAEGTTDRILAFLNTVNIQIEEGNTATSFEEYTGGASPNPDYPQNIQVVTGNNTIKVEGKNLFNLTNQTTTINGVAISVNGSEITLNGTCNGWGALNQKLSIKLNSNESYYLSVKNFTDNAPVNFTTPEGVLYNNVGLINNKSKITHFQIQIVQGKTYNNLTYKIQLEKSSTATTYEPYQEQTYEINLGDIELCKIGNYQDRIYKDSGKWYLHKEIGKVVLDGSESWSLQSINSHGIANFQKAIAQYIGTTDNISLVNYFSPQTSPISGETQEGYRLNTSKTFYVRIKSNTASTVENFKTWLSTHNTTVYYVLATPTTTEITDTTLISQLEAIKKSYNTQTNISQTNNDMPFELDVVALGELS